MRFMICVALSVGALLAGCASKEEPARQVVASADAALNELRPDAVKYAPDALQAAESSIAAARHDLEKKKYQDVLSSAPKLNEQLTTLKDTVVARQTQNAAATHEWEELSEEVPKLVDAIQVRVNTLSGSRLPKDIDKQSFETAKSTLSEMKSLWAEANAAFDAGNATEAADKGRRVQARAKEVSQQLGISAA